MSRCYSFDTRDRALLTAAAAETLRPAQLVSVAKLQHALSVLPKVTPEGGWQVELVTAGGDDCPGSAAGWPALQRGCTWNYADGGALRALSEDYRKQILATVRSPRLGTPEEIAAMVAFLFSDDGAYVNGQPILVDGGANFN